MLAVPSILRVAPLGWGVVAAAWALRGEVRRRRRVVEAAMVIAGAWLAVNAGIVLGAPGATLAAWLVERDEGGAGKVDAVFVYSGDTGARTPWAAEVWKRTGAKWLITSGAGSGGDDAKWIARRAVDAGVPASAIVYEERATTTRENVVFSAPLLASKGVRRVVVVTSPLHARRAAMAARLAWPGVEVISDPVPAERDECGEAPFATDRCRERVASEWEKLAGYFVAGWL